MEGVITTINVGGPSLGKGTAVKRRAAAAEIVSEQEHHIILMQEAKTKKDVNAFKGLNLNYDVISKGETKIFVNTNVFDEIKEEEIKDTDLKIADAELRNRIVLIKLKTGSCTMFVASWHGPHRRQKDEIKDDKLNSILSVIAAKCGNAPIIFGGDFNISYDKVKDTIKKYGYTLYHSKTSRKKIDYFLVRRVTVEGEVEALKYSKDDEKRLDHDPITLTVKFPETSSI